MITHGLRVRGFVACMRMVPNVFEQVFKYFKNILRGKGGGLD